MQRNLLGKAIRGLPAKAARELRGLVHPLDEVYLARSIPNPENDLLRQVLATQFEVDWWHQ